MKIIINLLFLWAFTSQVCVAQESAFIGGLNYMFDHTQMLAVVSSLESGGHYSGDIVIPSSVTLNGNEYSVYGVMEKAFRNASITSVVIPPSCVVVSNEAFYSCDDLKSVTFSTDPVTGTSDMAAIGTSAFENCKSLTSVKIPDGVSIIGNNAFAYCYGISELQLPNNKELVMGSYAFYCLEHLKELVIPDKIEVFGYKGMDSFFAGCSNLERVVVGRGVKVIYSGAFKDCGKLKEVVCYEDGSLEAVADCVFENTSLTTMRFLPHTLVEFLGTAFSGCDLSEVYIPSSVVEYGMGDYVYTCSTLYIEDGEEPLKILAQSNSNFPNLYLGRPMTPSNYLPYNETGINNPRYPNSQIIKKVSFGRYFSCSRYFNLGLGVEEIYSYSIEPWNIQCDFTSEVYHNATLYVPKGTKELYLAQQNFSYFVKVVEMSETGVESINATRADGQTRSYSLDGRQTEGDKHLGIKIEKLPDGSIRKVFSR